MLFVALTLLGILALAGLIVVYVAYPHRGEKVPRAPWLGDALQKGADKLPTLENPR